MPKLDELLALFESHEQVMDVGLPDKIDSTKSTPKSNFKPAPSSHKAKTVSLKVNAAPSCSVCSSTENVSMALW